MLNTVLRRLKRSRTSPHSPCPQPGSLTTASSWMDDAVGDVSHLVRSCRRGLAGRSYTGLRVLLLYCCCCEPEFDLALLYKYREPTRCCRLAKHAGHSDAVASRLGSKRRPRAARAEARYVLGDGAGGSVLTASPLS